MKQKKQNWYKLATPDLAGEYFDAVLATEGQEKAKLLISKLATTLEAALTVYSLTTLEKLRQQSFITSLQRFGAEPTWADTYIETTSAYKIYLAYMGTGFMFKYDARTVRDMSLCIDKCKLSSDHLVTLEDIEDLVTNHCYPKPVKDFM